MRNLTGFLSLYGVVQLVVCESFTFEAQTHPLFLPLLPLYFPFHIKFSPTWCLTNFLSYIHSAPFMEFNEVWLLCISDVFRFSFIDFLNNSMCM